MDYEIWIGLFALMGVLLVIRSIMNKQSKKKVLRVSPKTVDAAKSVVLQVLPVVEGNGSAVTTEGMLPCTKEQAKKAIKVLAYCFNKNRQHQELTRVRECFIGLSNFQSSELEPEEQAARAQTEKQRLAKEIDSYLAKHFG